MSGALFNTRVRDAPLQNVAFGGGTFGLGCALVAIMPGYGLFGCLGDHIAVTPTPPVSGTQAKTVITRSVIDAR